MTNLILAIFLLYKFFTLQIFLVLAEATSHLPHYPYYIIHEREREREIQGKNYIVIIIVIVFIIYFRLLGEFGLRLV